MDPHDFDFLDPDPHFLCGSGSEYNCLIRLNLTFRIVFNILISCLE